MRMCPGGDKTQYTIMRFITMYVMQGFPKKYCQCQCHAIVNRYVFVYVRSEAMMIALPLGFVGRELWVFGGDPITLLSNCLR